MLVSSLRRVPSTRREFFGASARRVRTDQICSDIGVWVGPQLREALEKRVGSLAFEGVSSDAYPADLAGFLEEGGSESAARSLAQTVTDYVSNCPRSTIIISGWRYVTWEIFILAQR